MNYRSLLEVECRFRVLKDFFHLRPCGTGPNHGYGPMWPCASTPPPSRPSSPGHCATPTCAIPNLEDQHLSAERALGELGRIRAVSLTAGEATIDVVARRSVLQTRILAALGVDTSGWERPRIS